MIVDLPIERLLHLPYGGPSPDEENVESKVSEEENIEIESQGLGQLLGQRQGLGPGLGSGQAYGQSRTRKGEPGQGLGRGKISPLAYLINQLTNDTVHNDDDVFSLLSSISLSTARKYHRKMYQKSETDDQVRYSLLLVDDR